MLKIKKIDHIAVCVPDIDEAAARWRAAFGLEARARETVESQKTEAVLLPLGEGAEGAQIELISPRGNEGLTRFLEKRGPGLHHVAIEVEGIESALVLLKSLGVPLLDDAPRKGARGHKVAFVHPKATGGVLVELVEPVETAGSLPAL
jgi:methylmalonyl-CoA/ethylmalonyl-CoA epimerase